MLQYLWHLYGPISAAAQQFMPWELYIILLAAILIATTVHEFGHAWMADRLGDPTPRSQKRVTLNPLAHLDPLGSLLMAATTLIGYPIGWGKPVRTNPEAYRTGQRVGVGLVAAAGPLANLLTAVLFTPVIRWMIAELFRRDGDVSERFLWLLLLVAGIMLVNLSLFVFNLTPVAPFDGSHILASLLPPSLSQSYRKFMTLWGPYLMLLLMITDVLPKFIGPVILRLFSLLIGIPL